MSATGKGSTLQANPSLQQKQQMNQKLIMSAHMQQALRLLQMPLQELEPYIEEQVVENPILELVDKEEENESVDESGQNEAQVNGKDESEQEVAISDQDLAILNRLEEDMKDHFSQTETSPVKKSAEEEKLSTFLEQSICEELSLQEQLKHQAHESFDKPRDLEIAETLIGYIDDFGFLKTPLSEICLLHHYQKEEVEHVLKEIQTFEPFGVGATSIQESLLIQLRCLKKENSLAYQIIQNHYDQLLHNQIPLIQKELKCPLNKIQQAIEKDIAKLDLHPGTHFSTKSAQIIIPDVTLREENEKLIVEVERDCIPSLRLNSRYLKMLNDPETPLETKQYVKRHHFSAKWLFRNLQQRFNMLERIAQSLADKQYDFFTKADGQLVPLIMKTLAEELNVHESTIARTVSNKYISSPRGIFPLRSFFTTKYTSDTGKDLSSDTVKQEIISVIEKEDKKHPLSDEKISTLLKENGIPCARRTVTKYRILLEIGNTQQRRKFGK